MEPAPAREPEEPPQRAGRRPRPGPDPEVFERRAGGWRLRLGPLAAGPAALACPALAELLDGGAFERAPCLCCFRAVSAAAARRAAPGFRHFLAFFDAAGYAAARAGAAAAEALGRDLEPAELAEVRAYHARLDATSEGLRALHAARPGLCAAIPACAPETLWVYSTPEGRRLLRQLGRRAPLRVRLALGEAAEPPPGAAEPAGAPAAGPEKRGAPGAGGPFPRFRLRLLAADRPGRPAAELVAEALALPAPPGPAQGGERRGPRGAPRAGGAGGAGSRPARR